MQVVILAGGSGTRFWPLSRRARPKQLLALEGERSLLQATLDRLDPLVAPEEVWVCTTRGLVPAVRRQLPAVPPEQVLAEPTGRDTAAAIGWSLRSMPPAARSGVVAILPADHRVADPEAFRRALGTAAEVAERDGRVMTLGVLPHRPETGYGHLELGEVLDTSNGVRRVARFVEKPDALRARRYFEDGRHLWNAGIFVFEAAVMLGHLARLQPELAAGLEEIEAAPERIDELYPTLPKISIDYAVMERLDDLGTIPLECGWSDLGSFKALAEELAPDPDGNVCRGDVLAVDSRDNLLIAEEGTLAVVGLTGVVVVRTADSVLVVPKERAQEVKAVVDALSAAGRDDRL